MREKIISIFLVMVFLSIPVYAGDNLKTEAVMNTAFNIQEVPDNISFTTKKDIVLVDNMVIPENSLVKAEIYQYQKERRWHKAGFFICKLTSFKTPDSVEFVDISSISENDFYFVAKKYEQTNKMETIGTGAELVATTSAAIFLPGIDILYFFTKGAINRPDEVNWFKSGVKEAYDNSIFWLWFKGKPIDLQEGENIRINEINSGKAKKMYRKIEKRHIKEKRKNYETEVDINIDLGNNKEAL